MRKMAGELTQEEIDEMFPESSKSTVAPTAADVD